MVFAMSGVECQSSEKTRYIQTHNQKVQEDLLRLSYDWRQAAELVGQGLLNWLEQTQGVQV